MCQILLLTKELTFVQYLLCNRTQTFYPLDPGKCDLPGSTTVGGAEPDLPSGNNTLAYRLHHLGMCGLRDPGDVFFFSVSIPCMGREEREPTQQTVGELHRASTCRLQRIPHSLSPSMLTFKVTKKHLQQMETVTGSHN